MILAMTASEYHWALDLQIWSGVIFVLLACILGVFVAPGVGRAMRNRQSSIVGRLKEAELAAAEIEKIRAAHKAERRRMTQESAALIKEAKADAQRLKVELVARAEAEIEKGRLRAQREITLMTQRAMHELWTTSAEMSVKVAQRILEQQLDANDHQRLIAEAVAEIGNVAAGAKT